MVLRLLFCCRIADAPPPFFPALDWLDAEGILKDIYHAQYDVFSYNVSVGEDEGESFLGPWTFAVGGMLAMHVTSNREARQRILVPPQY